MKAVITGGGTGGHIYPALAVANALTASGWDILYIGSNGGLEGRLIPEEGFPYREVAVAPLPRKISPAVLGSLFKAGRGYRQARQIIREYHPDVVVGTGGFVSGPVLLAAARQGYRTLVHEQNVYPGLTNRILARFVDIIALNFADAAGYFPERYQEKFRVTGNPVREVILKTTREEGLQKLGLRRGKKTLLVFGGSQGSMSINKAMLTLYREFRNSAEIQIVHITGEDNYREVLKLLAESGIDPGQNKHYIIIPYLKRMDFAYAAADLVVYRSGATGIAEITAKGIPAILIPYPYASGNHQEYNARSLEKHGAAVMILDRELTGRGLLEDVSRLINDPVRLRDMAEKSRQIGQPGAGERIYKLIVELVGGDS